MNLITSENMQEQENQNQDTQSTNTTTITPKKRGRPPKGESVQSTTQLEVVPQSPPASDTQVEELRNKAEQLEHELNMYKSIVESISITNTKQLNTCSDEDINKLYIEYISQNKTEHDEAFIIKYHDKTIIPKSYYVIG